MHGMESGRVPDMGEMSEKAVQNAFELELLRRFKGNWETKDESNKLENLHKFVGNFMWTVVPGLVNRTGHMERLETSIDELVDNLTHTGILTGDSSRRHEMRRVIGDFAKKIPGSLYRWKGSR